MVCGMLASMSSTGRTAAERAAATRAAYAYPAPSRKRISISTEAETANRRAAGTSSPKNRTNPSVFCRRIYAATARAAGTARQTV